MPWMELLAGHKEVEVRYNFENLYPDVVFYIKPLGVL
jgi:hypothetical protein